MNVLIVDSLVRFSAIVRFLVLREVPARGCDDALNWIEKGLC